VPFGVLLRAILQAVSVPVAGGKPRAVPGPEPYFTIIVHEYDLAAQDVDELVLVRVPVALARPGARRKPQQVDAELCEACRIAEP
jgi:hypothetical protein